MKKIGFLFVLLALILVVGIAIPAGNRGEKEQSAEEMVAYMQAELEMGNLSSLADVEEAIRKGEQQFEIRLSEEEKEKILEVMNKLLELGPDPDELTEQAKVLYEEYAGELMKQVKESVKESVEESISDYFKEMGNRMADFARQTFSL